MVAPAMGSARSIFVFLQPKFDSIKLQRCALVSGAENVPLHIRQPTLTSYTSQMRAQIRAIVGFPPLLLDFMIDPEIRASSYSVQTGLSSHGQHGARY
jgi:hypothetical protein